jgi:hypothetical protein
MGAVQIKISPPEASIYVDHAYAGSPNRYLDSWLSLPLGTRLLMIEAPGYYTHYSKLLVSGKPSTLVVRLVRRPKIGE